MASDRFKPAAVDATAGLLASDLSTNVVAFCASLRDDYHFNVGHAEARDSLRALEALGLDDERKVRTALRLVCCRTRDQTLIFDRAFDAFFRPPPDGVQQPADASRHTRPGVPPPTSERPERPSDRPKTPPEDGGYGAAGEAVERRPAEDEPDVARSWQTLRARYSPAAATPAPPLTDAGDDLDRLRALAARVVTTVRLGRSRRWQTGDRGRRFDLRRTIRANLQTGGDAFDLRFLEHPRHNPRFVVLIDGSRSMAEQTRTIVGFARALCERTARAQVFFFSTELLDVTRALRSTSRAGGGAPRLSELELGHAWGGGTKIGANLEAFISRHGARLLSPDTLVIIFSDGLDAGDMPQLERAMRTLDRRTAGIVWLNPHAASPGYTPTARAMRTALPFISLLTAANGVPAVAKLADELAHLPRLRRRAR